MKNGCSIFVGNIDFDVPEDKIIEELSAVGKVVNFRLVYDRSTGRSKGYGFCEYESPMIAERALQNLKIVFNGREVKCNYAENDLPVKIKEPETQPLEIDNLVSVLESMDKDNLKDVLLYLKRLAIDQPSYLKSLLNENPQLVFAIFHSMQSLKLVDDSIVLDLVKNSFSVDDQQVQVMARIVGMNDADVAMYPESVKERIAKLKQVISHNKLDK